MLPLLLSLSAVPDEVPEYPTWKEFAEARQGECVAGPGRIADPIQVEVGKHTYVIEGHRLVQTDKDKDDTLRIGVISATKDERDATLEAIGELIRRLRKLRIEILIVNGDIATHDFNMEEKLLPKLASAGVLVVAHVGNTESCGQFNQAAAVVFESDKAFINGNWVRQIELDDGTLFTLPGYHDKRFVHSGGAAMYGEEDLAMLKPMLKDAKGTRILVAHGPPAQKGKAAIDIATGAGHVGDPALAELLASTKVKFGIFGHILEAGGRGTDLLGKKKIREKVFSPVLYVNAGTANPDPWVMLDDATSYGMGLFFEVKGKKAKYQVLRLKGG